MDIEENNYTVENDEFRADLCIAQMPRTSRSIHPSQVKIISNWNFKGGVGKTTSTFGLAYALALSKSKKVLMVDADPQKNLTQLVARYYANRYFGEPVKQQHVLKALDENERGFHFAINQAFYRKGIEPAEIIAIDIEDVGTIDQQNEAPYRKKEEAPPMLKDRLFLLNGSYRTALLERELAQGYGANPSFASESDVVAYPAVFYNLMRETASRYGIEYVLVDLSPAISLLNTNILLSSDAFVLPCAPELFSLEALKSIPRLLIEGHFYADYMSWRERFSSFINHRDFSKLKTPSSYFVCPNHHVQFAGGIVTRFEYSAVIDTLGTSPSHYFQPKSGEVERFLDQVQATLKRISGNFVDGTCLPLELTKHVRSIGWTNDPVGIGCRMELGRLPELHKLSLVSQKVSVPAAYLHNRVLTRDSCNDSRRRQIRQQHREVLELIVDRIVRNFFEFA